MKNSEDCDADTVILNVEDTEFKCNRKTLAKCSPYFEAMFNGNFTEKDQKVITLKDVKVTGIVNILNLIEDYGANIPFEEIYDTLQSSSMLQFDVIKYKCEDTLIEHLSTSNCLKTWTTADRLDIHPLTEKAKAKSLMYFNAIRETDSILNLNIQELHSYLASTSLHCDNELDVFETAMKWYYDFYKKDETNCDTETKYLLVLLRCIDYSSMTIKDIDHILLIYPEISQNSFTKNMLIAIRKLMNDEQISDESAEERKAVQFYFNCEKRRIKYYPCIVCHEYNEYLDRPKRSRYMNCNCIKNVNVYNYDDSKKTMEKLIDLCMHNDERCNAILEGYQMVPYKENILFFGGEYQYGTSDWNESVWIYNTFKEEWNLLTKLPKARRHFRSIIIKDKLFIIGGTGKYRIIQENMMVYDIKQDVWKNLIQLPQSLFNIKCCEYKGNLFLISGNFNNRFGYFYNEQTEVWQRIEIEDPNDECPKNMGDFILFSIGEYLFIKGTHLIQMELFGTSLIVKKCNFETDIPIPPEDIGYCQNQNDLFIFSLHSGKVDLSNIYLLEKWNLEVNKTKTLLQINDNVDCTWNIRSGCFSLFHYKSVRNDNFVLDFVF